MYSRLEAQQHYTITSSEVVELRYALSKKRLITYYWCCCTVKCNYNTKKHACHLGGGKSVSKVVNGPIASSILLRTSTFYLYNLIKSFFSFPASLHRFEARG